MQAGLHGVGVARAGPGAPQSSTAEGSRDAEFQRRSWAVGSLPGFESVFVFLLGISHVGRQSLVQADALMFPSSDPCELGEDVW